eukprot:GEZU01023371.1.p1 GENE.GEZU01023371.1~~GEZU01023371.1.p1  ORF type:complete len:305 (+),score=56.99 GEZU01023371.1:233-1147(+)
MMFPTLIPEEVLLERGLTSYPASFFSANANNNKPWKEIEMEMLKSLMQPAEAFRWSHDIPLSHWSYPVGASLTYVAVVSGLKAFMKNRRPADLHSISLIHNVFLTTLSFAMFVFVIAAASIKASSQGVWSLFCERSHQEVNGAIGFITYVFYLSKYYELFDTVILALKKKPIIFLHVYHHLVMVIVTWAWLEGQWLAGSWWCVMVNSLVHTFMYYYYYSIISSKGRTVCWWKKYITQGQIVQFFTGAFVVTGWFIARLASGGSACVGGMGSAVLSHTVNLSFILLFLRFYKSTYHDERNSKNSQ